ncbi:MAG: hypothetical protein LCH78_15775 [Proteobacteria bacterium]|nr:hypothetical protein [Pseudomonadota bacterium]
MARRRLWPAPHSWIHQLEQAPFSRLEELDAPLFIPDLLSFGLDLFIVSVSPVSCLALIERAQEFGFDPKKIRRLGNDGVSFALPLIDDGRPLGTAQLDLVLHPTADGVHITGPSSLTVNPFTVTRALLFPEVVAKSLCGQANFMPNPEALNAVFLERTVALTAEIVDLARDTILELMPEGTRVLQEELWLRSAEAAHDFRQTDAFLTVQQVSHAAISQRRITKHDLYLSGSSRTATVPTARFRHRKLGEMVKVYPKTPKLVRLEVACTNRQSIKKLCSAKRIPFNGNHAADALTEFLVAARDVGVAALEQVKAVTERSRPVMQLALELTPLLQARAGAPVPGGYRLKEKDRAEIDRVYQSLVLDGRYWAKGAKPRSGLRRLLDSLCGPDGPLVRSHRSSWYFLKCEFAQAAKGFADNGIADASDGLEEER